MAFGFAFRRQEGRHRVYTRPGVREIVNVQAAHDGKAKAAQVRDFTKLVERYGLTLEDDV